LSDSTRRDFLAALGAAALAPSVPRALFTPPAPKPDAPRGVIVRTITVGVALEQLSDRRAIERALASLARAKQRFQGEGYEVQTTRLTLPPLVAALGPDGRRAALADVGAIDSLCADAGTMLGLGPVQLADRMDDSLAPWAAELVRATKTTSFSSVIASPARGVHESGVRVAAAITRAVADARPTGMGSFQYAAAANVPAGTPFFPVGWHEGPSTLAVGLQSPSVLREAFAGARDREDARRRLAARLTSELREVERVARASANDLGVGYGGIDSSPAPLGPAGSGGSCSVISWRLLRGTRFRCTRRSIWSRWDLRRWWRHGRWVG